MTPERRAEVSSLRAYAEEGRPSVSDEPKGAVRGWMMINSDRDGAPFTISQRQPGQPDPSDYRPVLVIPADAFALLDENADLKERAEKAEAALNTEAMRADDWKRREARLRARVDELEGHLREALTWEDRRNAIEQSGLQGTFRAQDRVDLTNEWKAAREALTDE